MKKKVLFVLLSMLLVCAALSPSAQDQKSGSLIGSLGFASLDFEGVAMDIGVEMQVKGNIYGQLLFDYYMDPFGDEGYQGGDYSAYGINLYGVYKIDASEQLKFFAKAGIHLTTVKWTTKIDDIIGVSANDSHVGAAAGIGAQYMLNDRWGILAGGTVKVLFGGLADKWLKFYGGLSYRVR
jgi:opacity protein-like surface antigen